MKKKLAAVIAAALALCALAAAFAACGREPVTLTLDKTAAEIFVGANVRLKATASRELAEDEEMTWSSDNENVATVKNGTVTGKADGTAVITVAVGGASAACTVTVKTRRTVTLSQTSATIDLDGAVKTLQLTATSSDGGAVEWKSSDTSVVTVDANGLVSAVDADERSRKATVTATRGEASASCEITVVKPSAPEAYDVAVGSANANVAKDPGVWYYFAKTSDGSSFGVESVRYSSDAADTALTMTLNYASEFNTAGKPSELYLRYQPNYESGTAYTFSCTVTANYAGTVEIGQDKFEVAAGTPAEISSAVTVRESMPLNVKLYFSGGTADAPLDPAMVIKLNAIAFALTPAAE